MIYLYRCEQCGKEFEVEQSIKDKPLEYHDQIVGDKCIGKIFKVILGGCGFILKGNGWTRRFFRR